MLSSIAAAGLAAMHALGPARYGPRVTAIKNIGRNYLRHVGRGSRYSCNGRRERERRIRQIAAGRLQQANGLVASAAK